MKQIPMTPEIAAQITAAVGPDVDQTGFAVFEAIALNTLPLPGKDGSLFEGAEVSYLTLRQMADRLQSGAHIPLISNHDPDTVPHGRVFHGQTFFREDGIGELRVLFYIDATEDGVKMQAKLNAGSLDEVSVSFLASQILCSDCDFDYRGEDADFENLYLRKCNNGHEIGKDGVHVRLVGLSVFTELSAVTSGAADNAKIVGKSQSKLAAPLQHLAAKGFEVDRLYLSASKGERVVDMEKLITDLSTAKADVITLNATKTELTGRVTTLEAEKTQLQADKTELETQLATAKSESKVEELATKETELSEARTILVDMYTKLATAAGETDVTAPESITELKAGIEKHQSKLTAILPIGGVSSDDKKEGNGSKFNSNAASAFKSGL